ncbi:MAG: Ig-like domain repeat protein [Acidobacteriota bacterium]|nr:Ig-like domain repeat protein [Acidobacteriota bacterium]
MSRIVRLNLVAGLGIAMALPALAAGTSQSLSTETTMTTLIRDVNAQTRATLSISVVGEDGQPVSGAVVIKDGGKAIAGTVLNPQGQTTATLVLSPGSHNLTAEYSGSGTYLPSASVVAPVSAATSATPDFSVSINPGSLSLTAGQSGTATVSITPVNASSLTAPMFVTLSCSTLPDQSKCTFTPENVEILPGATADVTSTLVLATQAASSAKAEPPTHANSTALAIMFPGALGLAGLAFGTRRRRWISRMMLIALVSLVATLGMTACSPLYYYKNHGPPTNLPTPSGTYSVNIDAQSSNGVTAITHNTTLALTVK